jgi:hypothetical protein
MRGTPEKSSVNFFQCPLSLNWAAHICHIAFLMRQKLLSCFVTIPADFPPPGIAANSRHAKNSIAMALSPCVVFLPPVAHYLPGASGDDVISRIAAGESKP